MDELSRPGGSPAVIERLHLPDSLWEQMRQHVTQTAPEEGCGLLGGRFNDTLAQASHAWPVENALHSPVRYQLEPYQQLTVFNALDDLHLDLIGIYHSHPYGPDHPSPTDVAEAFYPDTVQLIWSGRTGTWQCKAYTIRGGIIRPVKLEIDAQKG